MLILIQFLFSIFLPANSRYINYRYPISSKLKVKTIILENIIKEYDYNLGKISYKVNYDEFFKKCEIEKDLLSPYHREIVCDKEIDSEKLNEYLLEYGKELIFYLKNLKSFYVNYYNNLVKYDNKFLVGFKRKYEVFLNSQKEILFYSLTRYATGSHFLLNYGKTLPLYLNILIYLYVNNIKFKLKDIKYLSNNNELFNSKLYDKYKVNYLIKLNYSFMEDNFKVTRDFEMVVNIRTRKILRLIIKDILVNINIMVNK